MHERVRPLTSTRHIVGAWLLSRFALAGFVLLSSYLIGFDRYQLDRSPKWLAFSTWAAGRFSWADSYHYLRIARQGYLPPDVPCCDQAFFPGYPAAIRALDPLTGDWTRAGLLISYLAAAGAAVVLFRYTEHLTGRRSAATLAVVFLAAAPYGIFFSAVFTESLYLFCSLAAWYAGVRQKWWWAGLFATAAAFVRVNGLFLVAGLALMYLLQLRTDGAWRRPRLDAVALAGPLLAVASFMTYLHARTGSWTAWSDAQTTGWNRHSDWPWQGLISGWQAIGAATTPDLLVARIADLSFVVLGLILLVLLGLRRRWPELLYLSLSIAVLISSTTVQSSSRYALAWFPGYVLAAQWVSTPGRRHWAVVIVALCLPLEAAFSLALAAHLWVA